MGVHGRDVCTKINPFRFGIYLYHSFYRKRLENVSICSISLKGRTKKNPSEYTRTHQNQSSVSHTY